ncbi:Cdc6/Cdc18 family protein [Halobium palmae]|uniref:Cdc6/Cdc18 family protein n=1 Tax=Halobium palmae TaxID=1776492 RepID=A0ABD5RUZ9_9EURY
MIQDRRVLKPTFIPSDVVHRDHETRQLSRALKPLMDGGVPETAFLYGSSGAGKTCIAKFTVNRLQENVLDINHQYVNCWKDHSRFKTLYRVLEGIDRAVDIHRQSTPTDELLARLEEYEGPPYIVILDEADQLADTSVLYDLYRVRGVTLILIANREQDLFSQVGSRIASRLRTRTRIHFDQYSDDELASILSDRAQWGLGKDAATSSQLERIARVAEGDARVAIGILRMAAQQASDRGIQSVTDTMIQKAVPEAEAEIHQKNIQQLTEDQHLLYEILSEHDELASGELYDRYAKRASDPKTKRMVRNYLQKMTHYNLVIPDGESRGRTYRLTSAESVSS